MFWILRKASPAPFKLINIYIALRGNILEKWCKKYSHIILDFLHPNIILIDQWTEGQTNGQNLVVDKNKDQWLIKGPTMKTNADFFLVEIKETF